jgi:hypothetical protein
MFSIFILHKFQKDDDHGIRHFEIILETMTVWHRRLQGENETKKRQHLEKFS